MEKHINEPVEIRGKSTDIKSKKLPYGSTFYELDTLTKYIWTPNREWVQEGGNALNTSANNKLIPLGFQPSILYNPTTMSDVVGVINDTGFTLETGERAYFSIYYKEVINNVSYLLLKTYVLKVNLKGAWGIGTLNGLVPVAGLIEVESKEVVKSAEFSEFFTLGDIGTDTLVNYLNSLANNAYSLDDVDTSYYFSLTSNGNQQTYLYTGEIPINISETEVTITDFDLIDDLASSSVPVTKLSQLLDDIGATEREIVKVTDKSQIVNQSLDPTKKAYLILVDLMLTSLETIDVSGGQIIKGVGADVVSIITTDNDSAIFSGASTSNVNIQDITLMSTGEDSKTFDVADLDGSHEFRLVGVNLINCFDLGEVYNYRQWYLNDVGIYSISNGFTVGGVMSGIFFTQSNLTNFGGTLFKQGDNLSIKNRMYVQGNFAFNTGATFIDFNPSVFVEDESLQIDGCIASVDGVKNDNHANFLIPNISANNPKSLWGINNGLPSTAPQKIIQDTNVGGTYEIDWLNDTYDLRLINDTTFTEVNLPASGRRTKTINITISGDYTPTFPADWEINKVGSIKVGDLNDITIKFISTARYAMRISNSLSVYPAPILGSLTPVSLLPNSTSELVISGSFYTPQGFVIIDGQIVNTIEFDPDTGNYILSVTTGSLEGEFDITISNGTTVTFENRMIVNLGEVFIPNSSDMTITSGSADTENEGEVRIISDNSNGTVLISGYTVPLGQDFQFKFVGKKSPLKENTYTNGGVQVNIIEDGVKRYSSQYWYQPSHIRVFQASTGFVHPNHASQSSVDLSDLDEMFFERIGTQMSFKQNGITVHDFTDLSNVGDIQFEIIVNAFDIVDIKYIELP